VNAYKADDSVNSASREPMTRDEWIAYHVARAPKITRRQWADTLLLLGLLNREEADDGTQDGKAS
jgi:hypothetical protein